MTMVYLKDHNENIYNAENDPQVKQSQQQKQTRDANQQQSRGLYKSRFRGKVMNESQGDKLAHRTMGNARTPLTSPCNYLKKNEGIQWRNTTDHKCFKKQVPHVPRHNEAPKPSLKENKNIGQSANTSTGANRKEDKKQAKVTKGHRPRYADSVYGTVHDLLSSGLVPQYIFRPTFGKIPDYIFERKQQLQLEAEKRDHEYQERKRQMSTEGGAQYISQEERLKLLSGLKTNWEKLQKRYQGLPVLTDTEPKKIAKGNLERELRQLEQDIMLLENNPHIYVCDYTYRC